MSRKLKDATSSASVTLQGAIEFVYPDAFDDDADVIKSKPAYQVQDMMDEGNLLIADNPDLLPRFIEC